MVLTIVRRVSALEVSEEEELGGLDLALHGETAYRMPASGGAPVGGPGA